MTADGIESPLPQQVRTQKTRKGFVCFDFVLPLRFSPDGRVSGYHTSTLKPTVDIPDNVAHLQSLAKRCRIWLSNRYHTSSTTFKTTYNSRQRTNKIDLKMTGKMHTMAANGSAPRAHAHDKDWHTTARIRIHPKEEDTATHASPMEWISKGPKTAGEEMQDSGKQASTAQPPKVYNWFFPGNSAQAETHNAQINAQRTLHQIWLYSRLQTCQVCG